MGRKRTAEDYHGTAAENGWLLRAHKEEDRIQQKKDEADDQYQQNLQEALDQRAMWVPDSDGPALFERLPALHPPDMALLKQGSSTTKKRDKHLFDVDDLVNALFTPWTEDGFIFIHERMRDQMTFLILDYRFTGARRRTYLHDAKAEVKWSDEKTDKLVFEGLT
jgi:hypothetical protein